MILSYLLSYWGTIWRNEMLSDPELVRGKLPPPPKKIWVTSSPQKNKMTAQYLQEFFFLHILIILHKYFLPWHSNNSKGKKF